jgi:hypothetical protein
VTQRRCKSRHRKCWIIGTNTLWCYECGAVRSNTTIPQPWTYPVGPDAENPAVTRYRKKHP